MRLLVALALLLWPAVALPCAPAPPPGQRVEIVEEEALIIWDASAKKEHFVRRAGFQTEAASFGFLVPSPSVPALREVPNAWFDALEQAIKPKREVLTGYKPIPFALIAAPFLLLTGAERAAPQKRSGVQVLKTARVAGLDAVVLAADDPQALADWLKARGFASSPALSQWLKPYVEKRWKLTAFKIAKDPAAKRKVATSAVMMSFDAEEPFYPYREPEDQRSKEASGAARTLRVFLLSSEPMKGALAGAPWNSELRFRSKGAALPAELDKLAPGAWLHAWIDRSSPRPGVDDVFFAPDRGAQPKVPPPIVDDHRAVIPIPLDLLAVIGAFVWWRRRKKRAQ